MLQFFQTVCDRTFTVIKLHYERIGHLYDIDIWDLKVVQIILSLTALPLTNDLTSNLNSLIFFNNSHCFSIWTDYSKFGLILEFSIIRIKD